MSKDADTTPAAQTDAPSPRSGLAPAAPAGLAPAAPACPAPAAGADKMPREIGGPKGPEPTRYGDWEVAGRCTDF